MGDGRWESLKALHHAKNYVLRKDRKDHDRR